MHKGDLLCARSDYQCVCSEQLQSERQRVDARVKGHREAEVKAMARATNAEVRYPSACDFHVTVL